MANKNADLQTSTKMEPKVFKVLIPIDIIVVFIKRGATYRKSFGKT